MIKIGDVLDSLSLLESSTSPAHVPPRSIRTARRCPQYCTGRRESQTDNVKSIVKTEALWKEKKCPNVEIRNGVICTFERRRTLEMNNNCRSRKRIGVKGEEMKEKEEVNVDLAKVEVKNKISHKVGGPPSDIKSTQYQTKHFTKRVSFTKTFLDFKVVRKNHTMASNLDALLSQSLAGDASPLVPSGNVNVLHMSEFTSPGSLFGNEIGTGIDRIMPDSTSLDASYFKTESIYQEENGEDYEKLYNHPTPGFYHTDSWMTTPVSLPPTPEYITPNSPSVLTPHPTTPTLMTLPTYQQAMPPFSQPLTPESSSHSDDSKRDRDLMDILSFLQEPGPSVSTECDHFYSFQPPFASYDQMSSISSADDGASVYCASPSLLSTQHSPLSTDVSSTYSPNLSPLNSSNFSPLHCPISPNLTPRPQASTLPDTTRDLVHSSVHSDETGSNIPISSSRFVKPNVPNTDLNSLKRKSDSSWDGSSSKKCAVSGSVPCASRSKKRIITGTRKERKREQNKTAALRYRQKKKGERDVVDDRQGLLEEKNALLKSTLSLLEAEVDYLKKLWDEMSVCP